MGLSPPPGHLHLLHTPRQEGLQSSPPSFQRAWTQTCPCPPEVLVVGRDTQKDRRLGWTRGQEEKEVLMGALRPSVGAVVSHLILVKGVPHMRKLRLEKQVAYAGGWSSQLAGGAGCSRVGFGRVLRLWPRGTMLSPSGRSTPLEPQGSCGPQICRPGTSQPPVPQPPSSCLPDNRRRFHLCSAGPLSEAPRRSMPTFKTQ